MAKLKTVRFGIIGPGGAGRSRVRALIQDPAAQIVAAADTNPECLDKLEADVAHPVQRFLGPDGYKKMIDAGGLDAVGVFSPHTLHYAHTMYALENGLHVMIEKPMVCGVGNAIRSAKLAARKGLAYLITYQRHFEAKYVTARKLIAKGAIGEVQSFYVYMAQDWRGNGWRGDPKFSGGGQLNDSGSHYQDILLYMTALLPKSVVGSYDFVYRGQKRPIEINGSFSVELSNGAAGRLIIIGDYIRGFADDVRILGEKGWITFQGPDLFVTKPGKQPVKIEAKVPRGYPANPSDNFVKLLTGRCKENYVPALFGAQVALLTDAMLAAGRTRKAADCAALLKKAGYSYKDLAIKG
ncbi:MAG TPA: Gfo/Idh/MocA family oxidoreductase [Planctomycetota bacterium]|nr:Gfo/Idh/MocA family oxidoreductase [Planctomycetota bacterium]